MFEVVRKSGYIRRMGRGSTHDNPAASEEHANVHDSERHAQHDAIVPRKAYSRVDTSRSVIVYEPVATPNADRVLNSHSGSADQSRDSEEHKRVIASAGLLRNPETDEITSITKMTRRMPGRRVLWLFTVIEANRSATLALVLGILFLFSAVVVHLRR